MPHIVTIASRSHTIGSAIIRAGQAWRAWSHTADVLTAGGHADTVEALASRGGVVRSTVVDLTQHRASAHICLSREVSSDIAAARDAWLLDQVGIGYDWAGAILAGWAQWREWNRPDLWFCSELSAASAARHGLLNMSPYVRGVMPTQCVDLLLAAGWQPIDA